MPGRLRVRVDPLNPLYRHELTRALESEGFEVHTEEQIDIKRADMVVHRVREEGRTDAVKTIARALKRFRDRWKIGSRVIVIDAEANNPLHTECKAH